MEELFSAAAQRLAEKGGDFLKRKLRENSICTGKMAIGDTGLALETIR
jgi:hypothetical protein